MLTHIGDDLKPKMVGISSKSASFRRAQARSLVQLPPHLYQKLCLSNGHDDSHELVSIKGPVFTTAIIAGTMAVKRTSELIPFCHPLPIEGCDITCKPVHDGFIEILCSVETHHKTGVEMEALVGAAIAALTIYDMLKAESHEIIVSQTQLISKSGGHHDYPKPT